MCRPLACHHGDPVLALRHGVFRSLAPASGAVSHTNAHRAPQVQSIGRWEMDGKDAGGGEIRKRGGGSPTGHRLGCGWVVPPADLSPEAHLPMKANGDSWPEADIGSVRFLRAWISAGGFDLGKALGHGLGQHFTSMLDDALQGSPRGAISP